MSPCRVPLLGSALALGLAKGQRLNFNSVTPTVPELSSGHMYTQKIFIESTNALLNHCQL